MMNSNALALIFILFSVATFAQIPEGYYDSANNKTEEQLKAALHEIIKNHCELPYTSASIRMGHI